MHILDNIIEVNYNLEHGLDMPKTSWAVSTSILGNSETSKRAKNKVEILEKILL